jgi:ribosomal protein L11 methyltransferase
VVLVLAAPEDELFGAREVLRELGLAATQLVTPSEGRLLLLAPVADELDGARLVARLRAAGRPAVLRPDRDPQLGAWRRHTRPIVIRDQLTVCFVWSEDDRRGLPNVVELDPGGGFGSGHHPSTTLLLEQLAARISGGEKVLDVGCGSGVLGLCALRLGATRVVGIDIEAPAIEATRRNATLNGLEGRMEVTLGALDDIDESFDVVVANIGRAAVVELAPQLIPRVSSGGWLAVSGFSPPQCSLMASVLRPLRLREQQTRDEWAALVLEHSR